MNSNQQEPPTKLTKFFEFGLILLRDAEFYLLISFFTPLEEKHICS